MYAYHTSVQNHIHKPTHTTHTHLHINTMQVRASLQAATMDARLINHDEAVSVSCKIQGVFHARSKECFMEDEGVFMQDLSVSCKTRR